MADFTLFLNPRSPFARRIRLVLNRLQLPFQERDVGNVFEPQPELSNLNPLGLIPTLITATGEAYSDSGNLLEYLHELTGEVWPAEQSRRQSMRQISVWCTGIMQSAVLFFQEAHLHEAPSARWMSEHAVSVEDTLQRLNQVSEIMFIENGNPTQAGWDLGVALEYLDFRIPQLEWRTQFSRLENILLQVRKIEFFVKTSPH